MPKIEIPELPDAWAQRLGRSGCPSRAARLSHRERETPNAPV
jgi:hypothetical protein